MEDRFGMDVVLLKEVLDALDKAEAEEKEKVPVIIGLHRRSTMEALKAALTDLGIEGPFRETDRFLMVELSREEAEQVAELTEHVFRIWYDGPISAMNARAAKKTKEKTPLVADDSLKTINALAARKLFEADGAQISWAVLDSGIRAEHELFADNPIEKAYGEYELNFVPGEHHDDFEGHGTHVAGIIRQIAPQAKIYDFKVLDRQGRGNFSNIIQAMYTIRLINLEARTWVIHGANLSLGGPVPVGSYGVGYSPQCQEANLLMNSGVIVCIAAGNDGWNAMASTFSAMSIADPGNAEEVITVGSVHSTKPHTYGISYFSSKGPTGDGRFKPDVVAPGERIMSASIEDQNPYEPNSGTSMATPEVSGLIAQFLSIKKEFRGRAHDVKRILMDSCTDLARDRNFQGAGLVDALRMIQSV